MSKAELKKMEKIVKHWEPWCQRRILLRRCPTLSWSTASSSFVFSLHSSFHPEHKRKKHVSTLYYSATLSKSKGIIMRTDTLWRLTSLSDSEEELLEESELDEEEEEEDEERLTKTQWEQGSLDLRLDFWWQSGKLEKKQLSIWDVCVFVLNSGQKSGGLFSPCWTFSFPSSFSRLKTNTNKNVKRGRIQNKIAAVQSIS